MSKRKRNVLLSSLAILLGGAIYILLRRTTIVVMLFGRIPAIGVLQDELVKFHSSFLQYYFVDFLWCFSLSTGLIALHLPKKGVIFCAATAFGWGCLWEVLQLFQVVSGTADWCDIGMYFLASVSSILVNLRREMYEKD